jgi:hypothetical protein
MSRKWLVGLVMIVALLVGASLALAQDDGQNKIEFSGEITAMDGDTLVIGGFTVNVAQAEINTTLEIGAVVKVEGVLLDDGTVEAGEIGGADDPGADVPGDTLELVGTLDSVGTDTAVVGGVTFDITGATIEAGLAVGDLVKVHATLADDGETWMASSITSADPGDDTASGACQFEVDADSASLRDGPGTGYTVVGYAYEHDTFDVQATDTTGSWAQVGEGLWIAVSTGELHGDCANVPVSDLPVNNDNNSSSGDDGDDDNSTMSDDDQNDDDDDDSDDDSMNDDQNDDNDDDDQNNDDDHGSDDHHDDQNDDMNDDD